MVNNSDDFYWQTARDSLLTRAALTMFQIAGQYAGQDFDEVKNKIDEQYDIARGRSTTTQRHGGNFQTFIRVLEEAGWMFVDANGFLQITDAGQQAQVLLNQLPDFLRVVPFYLVDLLARFQLNNPTGPSASRNSDIREATQSSDIFPYWTIWRIMRGCDGFVTTDELRRFVFRLQRTEDVDKAIGAIREYRYDQEKGISEDEINEKYPPPLAGAVGEPKYIMARAGTQIGKKPPLIIKPKPSTFELNPAYNSLIDAVLDNEPVFREYLDAQTWMRDYGQPVVIEEEFIPFTMDGEVTTLDYGLLPDDDPVWIEVSELVAGGVRNILFVGPPGTSKTWYALHIGAKLADHSTSRFRNIQFHQSFGYEDFMEGYVPSESSSGGFILRPKTFLQICNSAYRKSDQLHVLVIDELNRGDPSRIFGEALTYIERRNERFTLSSGISAIVPSNLVLITTINPLDKSIAAIDMAMERRFARIEMLPSGDLLRAILFQNGWTEQVAGQLVHFFNGLNGPFEKRIGHAYFNNAKDKQSLDRVWKYQVKPVLEKEFPFRQDDIRNFETQFQELLNRLDAQES